MWRMPRSEYRGPSRGRVGEPDDMVLSDSHSYLITQMHSHTTHILPFSFFFSLTMLCSGYCSKEQRVQNECANCGVTIGKRARKHHWEGGSGWEVVWACLYDFVFWVACAYFVRLWLSSQDVVIKFWWAAKTSEISLSLSFGLYPTHLPSQIGKSTVANLKPSLRKRKEKEGIINPDKEIGLFLVVWPIREQNEMTNSVKEKNHLSTNFLAFHIQWVHILSISISSEMRREKLRSVFVNARVIAVFSRGIKLAMYLRLLSSLPFFTDIFNFCLSLFLRFLFGFVHFLRLNRATLSLFFLIFLPFRLIHSLLSLSPPYTQFVITRTFDLFLGFWEFIRHCFQYNYLINSSLCDRLGLIS